MEAIDIARRESFDLVLMDLFMPAMNGFECTRELRRLGVQCPIIAVSATINEEECVKAGMSGFVTKPITKASVLCAVQQALPVNVA